MAEAELVEATEGNPTEQKEPSGQEEGEEEGEPSKVAEADIAVLEKPAHVPRPDELAFRDRLAEVEKKISLKVDEQKALIAKIDGIKSGGNDAEINAEKDRCKAELDVLSSQVRGLQAERKEIVQRAETARKSCNVKREAAQRIRASLGRYATLEAIEQRIEDLENKLQLSCMSLKEEKALVAQINQLKKSRGEATNYMVKMLEVRRDEEAISIINQELRAKEGELKLVKEKEFAQSKKCRALENRMRKSRADIGALYGKRQRVIRALDSLFDERRSLKADFRKQQREHKRYMDRLQLYKQAIRRQKKQEEKEIEKGRKEEEEEDFVVVPWAEEISMIGLLREHLSDLLPKEDPVEEVVVNPTDVEGIQGMHFIGKKTSPADEGVVSKKKNKKKKKSKVTLKLSASLLQDFAFISVSPPLSIDHIPDAIAALDARLEHYRSLPPPTDAEEKARQRMQQQRLSGMHSVAPAPARNREAFSQGQRGPRRRGGRSNQAAT